MTNARTMLPPAGFRPPPPAAAAALFARATAVSPMLPRGDRGPGHRLFWLHHGALAWRDVAADGADHAVVGRHTRADVVLDGDGAVALRHFVVRARRPAGAAPRVEVLDLGAEQPVFVDGSDDPRRSFVAEGAVTVRVGAHVLCALPVDACMAPDAPAVDDDATDDDVAPPPRLAPPLLAAPGRPVDGGARSHTTTIHPARRTTSIEALGPRADPPWVRVVVRSPEGEVTHRLARADLAGLVMVGRYARCKATRGAELSSQVSRVHAGLVADGDAVEVLDLASTNGTWLDGRRVRRVRVEDAAVVGLGRRGSALAIERL